MGPTTAELERLRRALERSKEILNFVNQGVKEAEDKERLEEIQKRLDKTAFDKVSEHAIAVEFRVCFYLLTYRIYVHFGCISECGPHQTQTNPRRSSGVATEQAKQNKCSCGSFRRSDFTFVQARRKIHSKVS